MGVINQIQGFKKLDAHRIPQSSQPYHTLWSLQVEKAGNLIVSHPAVSKKLFTQKMLSGSEFTHPSCPLI